MTCTGSTLTGLQGSGAVLLPNGQVFAIGNDELYNPMTGSWSTTTSPPSNRGTVSFNALLPSGKVWVGGIDESFTPATAQWSTFGQPSCITVKEHCGGDGALLTNSQVLVAGGILEANANPYPIAETIKTAVLWDPATLAWTSTGDLVVSRTGQSMTRLLNGQVLVAGGVVRQRLRAACTDCRRGALYTLGSSEGPFTSGM